MCRNTCAYVQKQKHIRIHAHTCVDMQTCMFLFSTCVGSLALALFPVVLRQLFFYMHCLYMCIYIYTIFIYIYNIHCVHTYTDEHVNHPGTHDPALICISLHVTFSNIILWLKLWTPPKYCRPSNICNHVVCSRHLQSTLKIKLTRNAQTSPQELDEGWDPWP